MEVTAIIVARAGSVRIKSKSMSMLLNETLIQRKIRQLKESKKITRIVFGSDSDEMLEHAKSFGAEVVRRPDYFCDEKVCPANDMISNMCELVGKTDYIVWAHCTNPLIEGHIYDDAFTKFMESGKDSLLSVIEMKEHTWIDGKPFNYNPYGEKHVPARELKPFYIQDGGIFIQPWEQMRENKYFFGRDPYLYTLPSEAFLDINDERDLLMCRGLLKDKINQ